jgi:hypothetical protein
MKRKMGRLTLAALALTVGTSVLGSEYLGAYAGFQGFYVAGAGSFNFLQAQTSPDVTYYADGQSAGVGLGRYRKTITQTKNQLDGYAGLGYSFVNQQHYYFGLSVFAETHSLKYDSEGYSAAVAYTGGETPITHVSQGFAVKAQNMVGLKFSPGYLVTPNDLVYLNLGGVFGNVKFNIGESYYLTNGTGLPQDILPASKKTKDAYGFIGGIGYEHLLAQHVGLFVSYNYTYLSSKVERQSVASGSNERDETYKALFQNSQLSLGMRLRF